MALMGTEESFTMVWHEASKAMCLSLAETFEEEWAGRTWTSEDIAAKLRHIAATCPSE